MFAGTFMLRVLTLKSNVCCSNNTEARSLCSYQRCLVLLHDAYSEFESRNEKSYPS